MILSGKIEKIEDASLHPHDKKVVTVVNIKNKIFVEFRGPSMLKMLEPYSENDNVIIDFNVEGKISKLGVKYNNIVARTIQKV